MLQLPGSEFDQSSSSSPEVKNLETRRNFPWKLSSISIGHNLILLDMPLIYLLAIEIHHFRGISTSGHVLKRRNGLILRSFEICVQCSHIHCVLDIFCFVTTGQWNLTALSVLHVAGYNSHFMVPEGLADLPVSFTKPLCIVILTSKIRLNKG